MENSIHEWNLIETRTPVSSIENKIIVKQIKETYIGIWIKSILLARKKVM